MYALFKDGKAHKPSKGVMKIPYGYQLVHFIDVIIALPIWEPAFRPKFWNIATRRWNYIDPKSERLKQAYEFYNDVITKGYTIEEVKE